MKKIQWRLNKRSSNIDVIILDVCVGKQRVKKIDKRHWIIKIKIKVDWILQIILNKNQSMKKKKQKLIKLN